MFYSRRCIRPGQAWSDIFYLWASSKTETSVSDVTLQQDGCQSETRRQSKRGARMRWALKSCIEWRYSYSVYKFYYDHTGELNHSDTKVWLVYPTAKTVMIYQDVYLKNYFNILGDIGGILGVWIGGSIISILQFLYIFGVKPFCECQDSESKSKTTCNETT
uniref:Uncharacterized protein n=1 Tax=Romanomermis culicivorax TaxID=13658 RepID=A0A915K2P3_ROMCU